MVHRRDAAARTWLEPFADPALLARVVARVPLGVYLVDADEAGELVLVGANDNALRDFGADVHVTGRRISDLLRPDGTISRTLEAARTGDDAVTARVRVAQPDGQQRVIEVTVVPMGTTLIGVSHDVTDAVGEAMAASAYSDAILRSTPDQVWVVARDLTVRHVGGSIPETPEPATRYIGRKLTDALPASFTERARRLIVDTLEQGGMHTLEYSSARGGVYEVRAVALNDDEVLALVRDVRERRTAEHALQTRSELDSLVADISRHLLSAPATGRKPAITDALGALATRLGADSATLALREGDGWFRRTYRWFDPTVGPLGEDLPDRLPPEAFPWALAETTRDRAGVVRHAADLPDDAGLERAMLAEIGAQSAAMVPIRADGSLRGYITFYWRARPAGDDEQVLPPLRVIGDVLVAAHDLANAELQRDESDELLRTVFESLDEAILVTASDGIVLSGNRAATEMFERSIEELVGRTYPRASLPIRDDGTPFVESELPTFATLADGMPRSNVLEGFATDDGPLRWLSVTTRPLRRPGTAAPYAVVTSFTDVTQIRALEAQLALAAKMEALGRLAGGVAHDFNNLLTVISGYAGLLLEDVPAESELRGDLEEIAGATTRAASLVDQLLSFSRHKVAESRAIDLNDVVRDMESLLRRTLPATIDIETHFDASPSVVRLDRGQLEQVLLNLAVNAGDAMPGGGRLIVETTNAETASRFAQPPTGGTDGPFAVLSVSDTGQGMDRATQARAFEPFFTTKPVGQGTGLGLSTVYGVVAHAQGHVGLYSEPGAGTTVRVYLPLDEVGELVDDQVVIDETVTGGTETILVVEDDPSVRAFTVEALQRLGYAVIEAADGSTARHASRTHQRAIDLLLTDVVLPDTRGTELAAAVRETRHDLPVLLMSGYSETVLEGSAAGTIPFLQKPFQLHELARAVRAALDHR
jgi:PAS domain S-box-containing protein